MPIISTLGALTYDKVPLLGSNTFNYWYLTGNQTYAAGTSPEAFNDFVLIGNDLFITTKFGGNNALDDENYGVIKVSQNFVEPIVAVETNFLDNRDYVSGGYENSNYEATYINTDSTNSKILLTGRATVGLIGNIAVSSQHYPNYGGAIFSSLDASLNFIVEGYVDRASNYTYPFPPNNYSYWYRQGSNILMDDNGNYYIGGWVNEQVTTTTTNYVGYLTKFSGSTNTKIWSKIFNQAGSPGGTGAGSPKFQNIATLKFDTSGNILMLYCGPSTPIANRYLKMVSVSPSGTLNWQLKMPNTSTEYGTFDIDSDGNIYVLFTSGGSTFVQKYDTSRSLIWSKITSDGATPLGIGSNSQKRIVCKDGKIFAMFSTNDYLYIAALDSSGNILHGNKLSSFKNGNIEFAGSPGGMTFSSSDMYILMSNANKGVIKLPSDGTVPGTGNYFIGSNTYINYETVSLSNSSNSYVSFTSGNLTMETAQNTSYSSWVSYLETDNTVQPTRNIDLEI